MGSDSIIRVPDIFGLRVEFRFQQNLKSESKFGKLITICLSFFMIFIFFFIGREMWDRDSPKTNISNLIIEDPTKMLISPETFNIAIGLEDSSSINYFDESIYTVKMNHITLIRTTDSSGNVQMEFTKISLNVEPCTTDHFGSIGDKFENSPLSLLYCISSDQPSLSEIGIQGVWESDLHTYLEFSIQKCDNDTSTVTCASSDVIDQTLLGGKLLLLFTDTSIDPTNYEDPNTRYKNAFFTTVGPNYIKNEFFYVQNLELKTDTGFLSDYVSNSYIAFDSCDDRIDIDITDGIIAQGEIKQARDKTLYERSYMKLTDVLSVVNGVFAILYVILFFVLKPFLQVKFYETLINDIFEIRSHNDLAKSPLRQATTSKEGIFRSKTEISPAKKKRTSSFFKFEILNKKNKVHVERSSAQKSKSNTGYFVSQQNETSKDEESGEDNRIPISEEHRISEQVNDNELEITPNKEENGTTSLNILKSPRDCEIGKLNLYKPEIMTTTRHEIDSTRILSRTPSMLEKECKIEIAKIDSPIEEEDVNEMKDIKERRFGTKVKSPREDTMIDISPSKRLQRQGAVILDPEKNKLDLGFFEYLYSKILRTKKAHDKFELLDEGVKKINKRLDVFNLMKKMREIDKLKAILFDANQLALFEYLPKPILSTERMRELKPINSVTDIRRSSFENIQFKSDIAYNFLAQKKEKSDIDLKLMKNYEELMQNDLEGVNPKF